MSRSEKR